jgi:hypothetical protein
LLARLPAIFPVAPQPASAANLAVPFLSQYAAPGGEQRRDSGPASVAMVVALFYPEKTLDGALLAEACANAAGAPDTPEETSFLQLERALAAYGLGYGEISMALRPAPEAQVQAIQSAVGAGEPVIALVHGPSLGRRTTAAGQDYSDCWLVVTGFSADGQTVYVNDPDTADPPPGNPTWRVGGQVALDRGVFRQAAYEAAPGLYGLIVSGPAPRPTPTESPVAASSSPTATTPTAPPAAIDPSSTRMIVRGTSSCLRVRSAPALRGDVVGCLNDGTRVAVREGRQTADGQYIGEVSAAERTPGPTGAAASGRTPGTPLPRAGERRPRHLPGRLPATRHRTGTAVVPRATQTRATLTAGFITCRAVNSTRSRGQRIVSRLRRTHRWRATEGRRDKTELLRSPRAHLPNPESQEVRTISSYPLVYQHPRLPRFRFADGADGARYVFPNEAGGWADRRPYHGPRSSLRRLGPEGARHTLAFTGAPEGEVARA